MKKILIVCLLCFFVAKANAQKKISFSLFTYTLPKGAVLDETDSAQKLYMKFYEGDKYLYIYVWDKKKAAETPAADYKAFINELQSMYPNLKNQYSREPTIKTENGFNTVWQTASAKTTHEHIKTEKVETIAIEIKVLTAKKQTAAIHIVSNDMDRAKGDVAIFLKSLKKKKQ
jgi:phospholipase/lecithinase/hemolysin